METFGVLVVKAYMKVFCEIVKDLGGMFNVGEKKTLSKQIASNLEEKGYLKILGIKQKKNNIESRMVDKVEVKLNIFEL